MEYCWMNKLLGREMRHGANLGVNARRFRPLVHGVPLVRGRSNSTELVGAFRGERGSSVRVLVGGIQKMDRPT